MKRIQLMQLVLFSFVLGTAIAFTGGLNPYACIAGTAGATITLSLIGLGASNVLAMAAPDVSALTTDFVKFGGKIFGKRVNEWNLTKSGILVMSNVNKPEALTKLSAQGNPRPYREQADTAGNGAAFTDRILTVRQSKWDFVIDPEKYRQTYLANTEEIPYYKFILDQVSKEYLAAIEASTIGRGVYNGAGSATADIADGFRTIVDAEIVLTNLVPIVTGAITSANAVTKVELVASAMVGSKAWMRKVATRIKCSWETVDKYKAHYRTLNGFNFKPDDLGRYKLDGYNCYLDPEVWMGSSDELILTVDNNLVAGTDSNGVKVYATPRMNLVDLRLMMPIGAQIQDLDAMIVNDQF